MFAVFFNIIKWKELLYFIFLLFLFKYCFLYGYGFETTLSFFDLSILSVAGGLILASGHLNSYFYKKHYKRILFSIKKARRYSILFGFLGILLGVILSFKIQKYTYSSIFIFCFIFVFIYSKKIKKKTFINNLFKSFLKAFVILTVCWFDSPTALSSTQWDLFSKLEIVIVAYVLISFLSNIVREIVIDINNINSDSQKKHKTLPILLGRKRAKNIALTIAIIGCFFVFSLAIINYKNTYIFTTIILLGTIPELVFIYFLINASSTKNYKKLQKNSNIVYFLAVLSVPIIAYYFKYVIG